MIRHFFLITLISFQSILAFGQNKEINSLLLTKIDSLFHSHFKADKPGCAFAIIRDGKTIFKKVEGMANLEHGQSITDSTVFNIASVSKQFTTYLALLLEEEGKLSFQDDIRTHLPELNHLPYKITIKDLTNHTHGLANSYELASLKGITTFGQMNHEQTLKMLLNIKHPNYEVGDKYEYNNTGYILLSEIITRVANKSFKELLKQKIFLPLGMKHTEAIDDNAIVVAGKAYSYEIVGDQYQNLPLKLSSIGSSGIYSSLNDMILWANNYQRTKVGKPEFYRKMQEATILNSGQVIKYGMGLQFENYKGLDIVFHGGGTAAYRSYILHIPKHNLSFTLIANSNDFSGLDMVYRSIDILFKKFIKEENEVIVKLSEEQLLKFNGTYEFQPGVYFKIMAKDDSLFFQSHGSLGWDYLPHLRNNTFTFPPIPYSHLTFHKDRFDFRVADFTYECLKTKMATPQLSKLNLADYKGFFKNNEHNIIFELEVLENQLILKRRDGIRLTLIPFSSSSFFSDQLGKLDFTYDKNGRVIEFKLSGQNFNNLIFYKECLSTF